MTTGARFTDSVVAALSQDAEVLGSMVQEPVWDEERNVLLIRIEPKEQEKAQELGEKVVELIRSIKGERFKAEIQKLNVDQERLNFIFKLTVQDGKPEQNSQ